MEIMIEKYESKAEDDQLFGEAYTDYSVNIRGNGEILTVRIPEEFELREVKDGIKCLYGWPVYGMRHATKIEEKNGKLGIAYEGIFHHVEVIGG